MCHFASDHLDIRNSGFLIGLVKGAIHSVLSRFKICHWIGTLIFHFRGHVVLTIIEGDFNFFNYFFINHGIRVSVVPTVVPFSLLIRKGEN